jgi:hypothetical protein
VAVHLKSVDFVPVRAHTQFNLETAMAPAKVSDDEVKTRPARKLSGIGATEDQIDMRDTVPQRTDRFGTKIEDLAGTGEIDSAGG